MQKSVSPISREEYVATERTAPVKHELLGGEMRPVSGKGFNHAAVTGNCFVELRNRLQPKGCRPLIGDLRVHAPSGLDAYPDCSVVRGQPQLGDDGTTLLNPMMIVEVVSCGTSSFDRGDKFRHYRSIPNLMDYLVVDSEEVSVEHFRRADNGEWVLCVPTRIWTTASFCRHSTRPYPCPCSMKMLSLARRHARRARTAGRPTAVWQPMASSAERHRAGVIPL